MLFDRIFRYRADALNLVADALPRRAGVRLSDFLKLVGVDTRAKYVTFRCDDEYVTSIDMATALHGQTQLCLWMDGQILPRRHGYPL